MQATTDKGKLAPLSSRAHCATYLTGLSQCSEGKPSCTHCTRHNVTCQYEFVAGVASQPALSRYSSTQSEASANPSAHAAGHAHRSLYIDLNRPQHLFHLKDMELLHHWNLVTSLAIIDSPDHAEVWRIQFPRIAFQHPYVMHSLLSLAALHVAYLNPSQRRASIIDAACHHTKALEGFHEATNHIDAKNSDAVFATATLLFFYTFVTLSQLYDDVEQQTAECSRVSRVLGAEWIPLLRGVGAVLPHVHHHVSVGPLGSVLGLGNWEAINPDENPTADDEKLIAISQIWKDDPHAQIYETSLLLLRQFWVWMVQLKNSGQKTNEEWGYHGTWSGPFIWLSITPEKFFDLQLQRQPAALVLFAHFGAFLQMVDGYWWGEGCGRSIVKAIDGCLGSYWEPWTRWPKEVVGLV